MTKSKDAPSLSPALRADRKISLAYIFVIACLIGVASYSHRSMHLVRATTNERAALREGLVCLERSLSLLKDAETGQRGFLLTNRSEYLEPYYQALEELDRSLETLKKTFRNDAEQNARFIQMTELAAEKLSVVQLTIQLAQKGQLKQAVAKVQEGSGKRLMDRIRHVAEEIRVVQKEKIRAKSEQVDKLLEESSLSLSLSSVFALVCVAFVLVTVERSRKRNWKSEQELIATRHNLENRNQQIAKIIEAQFALATGGLEPRRIMEIIVHHVTGLIRCDGAVMEVRDGEDLVYHVADGPCARSLGQRIKIAGSFSGLCMQSKEILICEDTRYMRTCRKLFPRSTGTS